MFLILGEQGYNEKGRENFQQLSGVGMKVFLKELSMMLTEGHEMTDTFRKRGI